MTIQLLLNGPEIVVLEKLVRIGKMLFKDGYTDKVTEVTEELDTALGLQITQRIYDKVSHELKHGDRS